MTHTPAPHTHTRRAIAKGAAWSIPAISVAAAAPSLAASPCAGIKLGQALPASAFAPGYFAVTNQTFGGVANKVITFVAGISLTTAAATCVGSRGLTLNWGSTGSIVLTNGTPYTVSGGTAAAGTGTTGTPNSGCTRDIGGAQACITATGVGVANSTGTSSANPRSGDFTFTVNVAGYGTTTVHYTLTGFTQSGTNWNGTGLTIS